MDNEQAKFLLQAYRPGGQDAQDPLMAEALEQARRDPELGAWLAREQALDATVAAKLKTVPVPPELRAHILAGNKVVRLPLWQRTRIWWTAAAAVAAVLLVIAVWMQPPTAPRFADFRQAMVEQLVANHAGLDHGVHSLEAAQQWLRAHHADAQLVLPTTLVGVPARGCRILEWDEHQVTMICLALDGTHHVDLFVIDRADFPDLPPQSRPRLARVAGLTTACWQAGGHTYLLAGTVREEVLRKYL